MTRTATPQREVTDMGLLWEIVQAHIDSSPYPPSYRQVARRLGVTPTTLTNWRDPQDLPRQANLRALATLTGTPYDEVLRAALVDTGYFDRAREASREPAQDEPSTDASHSA